MLYVCSHPIVSPSPPFGPSPPGQAARGGWPDRLEYRSATVIMTIRGRSRLRRPCFLIPVACLSSADGSATRRHASPQTFPAVWLRAAFTRFPATFGLVAFRVEEVPPLASEFILVDSNDVQKHRLLRVSRYDHRRVQPGHSRLIMMRGVSSETGLTGPGGLYLPPDAVLHQYVAHPQICFSVLQLQDADMQRRAPTLGNPPPLGVHYPGHPFPPGSIAALLPLAVST